MPEAGSVVAANWSRVGDLKPFGPPAHPGREQLQRGAPQRTADGRGHRVPG